MINIMDNGLSSETKLRDIIVALSGVWGETGEGDIYLGKVIVGIRLDTDTLAPLNDDNGAKYDTMAIVAYTDGTSDNLHITTTTSMVKQVSMAILIAGIK